eukprot:TRINITY_DN30376_c1_g1_i1.p1 TRINITY_DN30376_c1_g1~~TRINITY_DN30376_c1_g1_i1.p1  ORF type:complete len:140 (-),score=10.04 TRINITY_DN30376_c1_g1_i1:128-547(-)
MASTSLTRAQSQTSERVMLDLSGACEELKSQPFLLLLACLLVDFIGVFSYLLFFIGEATDVFWAPISGFFLHYYFGSMVVSMIGSMEEILPFTDILPTATIAWCIANLESLEWARIILGVRKGGAPRVPQQPVQTSKDD